MVFEIVRGRTVEGLKKGYLNDCVILVNGDDRYVFAEPYDNFDEPGFTFLLGIEPEKVFKSKIDGRWYVYGHGRAQEIKRDGKVWNFVSEPFAASLREKYVDGKAI